MQRDAAGLDAQHQPMVQVIATTIDGTHAALKAAVPLAKGSGAKLIVVVPRIVPYALHVDEPSGASELAGEKYRRVIADLGGAGQVQVCSCRRLQDVIDRLVSPDATVVIGGPCGGWRMSPEQRFANRLGRDGRHVIYVTSGRGSTYRRVALPLAAAFAMVLASGARSFAQPSDQPAAIQYGAFVDVADLFDSNSPSNHLFRNRGTTPRVDELDVNMAAAYFRKAPSEQSRVGVELTAQTGEDAKVFGFSATASNIGGADVLLHFGPTNVSYLAPVGKGLTLQGGIFSSLIGYDSLYAKDNFAYTRPWGADYTPYLMLGVNAAYPFTPKLTATAIVVNGYWHLANANDVPTIGGQLAYKTSDAVTVKQTALYGPHQENTSLELWRVLSDTIVERKRGPMTAAFEYQLSTERVAHSGTRAWWTSAQLPVHWTVGGPVAATVRPEVAWDSDGRWTGFPQRVIALTAGGEYRWTVGNAQAIVRAEYRVDDSRGDGGGFFAGADNHLSPTQNLFVIALIVAYDGTIRR